MGNIDQLVKKYPKSPSGYRDVNPNTFTDAVKDRKTKETLEALISRNNFIHLPYIGSKENTRLQLDIKFRRKGLWVGYITHDKKIVVEYYNNDNIENEYWKDDLYWIPYSEALNISLNEEDLTYTSRGIEFANRDTTQGMGKIIVRRNKPILKQFSQANTIYEICYDFDLKDKTLEIPDNCILDFKGGSFNNGTIILNNDCKVLGKNTTFNTHIIVKGRNVTISDINIEVSGVCVYGDNPYDVSNLTINNCNLISTKDNCIKIVTDTLDGVVENINIRNSNMKFHRMGIELQNHGNDSVRFVGGTITNCKFSLLDTSSYNYGYAISLSGRGNNINITDCLFDKCYMGIELVGFNYTIISNNKMINGIGTYLIAATNVRRMTGTLISNNTFDGQGLFITNTDRAHIIDNIFTNNRGITFTASNRCLFKENNCIFTSNTTTAVMLENSYNCRIEDNNLDISASTNFFSIMRAYGSNAKYNVFRSNFIAKPEGGNVFDQINEASNNYCYDYYFINNGSHSSTEINSLNNNITSSVNSLKNSLLHKVSESFSSLPIGTCCLVYGVNSAGKVSNPKLIIRKATALDNNKIDINLKFMFRDGNNQHYANVRLVDSSYSLKNPYVEKSGSMSSITYAKTTDGDYTVYTITFSGAYEDAIVQGFAYCSSSHNISWCG